MEELLIKIENYLGECQVIDAQDERTLDDLIWEADEGYDLLCKVYNELKQKE